VNRVTYPGVRQALRDFPLPFLAFRDEAEGRRIVLGIVNTEAQDRVGLPPELTLSMLAGLLLLVHPSVTHLAERLSAGK
jgi:hypothetical protein